MGIEITEVRIFKINRKDTALLGYANVTINNCFVVHGIKILEKNGQRFIAMPSRITNAKKKTHLDWCHPINSETRNVFVDAILEAYDEITED